MRNSALPSEIIKNGRGLLVPRKGIYLSSLHPWASLKLEIPHEIGCIELAELWLLNSAFTSAGNCLSLF